MKVIRLIGEDTLSVKMFNLELAWVLSFRSKVCCHISDKEFYNYFAFDGLESTSLGNLNIMSFIDFDFMNAEGIDYFITNDNIKSDINIYVLEQNIRSAKYINLNYDYESDTKDLFVYLNFIDSVYDSDYFKRFKVDKTIDFTNILEFEIEFDEKTKECQLENQIYGIISLKKYPKGIKKKYYNMVKAISTECESDYKHFYKVLDKRVYVC